MGQVCSGRRAKPSTTRPLSQPEPPPYSAPKSPTTSEGKEEPELSTHPALRERGKSLSDPSDHIHRPSPAHLRGKSLQKEKWNGEEQITASSTPQWRWSNTQCRAWLTQVLIVYGGRPSPVAHRLADSFRGWGPNLYMKEWKEWNTWLGADGQAIFALLMEEHGKEGAVPKDVEIEHYVKAEGEMGEYKQLEIGLRSKYPLKRSSTEKKRERRDAVRMREEVDSLVQKEDVQDAKQQVASEWGKGRLKKLTEEREKLKAEREHAVGESTKELKSSRRFRRLKSGRKEQHAEK